MLIFEEMNYFKKIFELPFMLELEELGSKQYIVGGACRDFIQGIEPKDIDIVVCGMPAPILLSTLEKYGKTSLVGESFGVFKFDYLEYTYDISITRTDTKISGLKGHKSIESQSDHTLSIEQDLARRDFRFNAFCIGRDLEIIDPFEGVKDLKNGIVDCVTPDTFLDDPLRMIRAIQFAARFNFDISPVTFGLIESNKHLIREITPERILIEFQKVFDKGGNISYFANLLHKTGLFKEYFGLDIRFNKLDHVQFLSEFLHFSIADTNIDTAEFFKKRLMISTDLWKEIYAFYIVYSYKLREGQTMSHIIFAALQKSDIILKSGFIPDAFKVPFISGEFPKTRRELAISGDKLIELGYKDKEIGILINKCLDMIFTRQLKNDVEELLEFAVLSNQSGK